MHIHTHVFHICAVYLLMVCVQIGCHSWYSAYALWHTHTTSKYTPLLFINNIPPIRAVIHCTIPSTWLPCHPLSPCSVCVLVCCVCVCRCVCDACLGAVSEDPHTVFSHSHVYAWCSLCVRVCLHGCICVRVCCVCVFVWCVGTCVTYVCALCTKYMVHTRQRAWYSPAHPHTYIHTLVCIYICVFAYACLMFALCMPLWVSVHGVCVGTASTCVPHAYQQVTHTHIFTHTCPRSLHTRVPYYAHSCWCAPRC